MRSIWIVALAGLFLANAPARGAVVINEIFYHAPDDLDDIQWIELRNTANEPVNLAGWRFNAKIGFKFPAGAKLDGGGYVVVARNPEHFKKLYGMDALGPMEKPLGRSGGRIELLDGDGKRVDAARYKDRSPWPIAADGYSASLERISPNASGELAENWAASPMPGDAPRPAGTPGHANTLQSDALPPVVSSVKQTPEDPSPREALRISAQVKDAGKIKEVALLYTIITAGKPAKEAAIAMKDDEGHGLFNAEIPAQPADTLIRYRIRAIDQAGAQLLYPAENDLRPALSAYVHEKWEAAKIPLGRIIHVQKPGGKRRGGEFRGFFGGGGGGRFGGPGPRRRGAPPQPLPPRGDGAFVFVGSKTGKTTLFDFINIAPRDNERGFKIHFHKDRTLNGMSAVSVIFEGNERFLLAEALAYDVYRRAGNAAPLTDFIRLWVDGRMTGYHLMIERPNRSFLRRNGLNDDGNLYKLLWYGGGLVGQHEKKTNRQEGHDDLVRIVDRLNRTHDGEQWKVIDENFNVDQAATYFAVNMVLSHWDGFFNNYYTYHDIHGSKKWEMYPWDQDKTWGYFDGIGRDEVFYNMPLTFGMAGATPPGGGRGGFFGGGGTSWWRDGGFFSAPLLANPQFRTRFLLKTKEILQKVYTKEIYFPVIDELAARLKEDVALRSKMTYGNAEAGLAELAHNVQSLKAHLEKRREFLLKDPELRGKDRDVR